MARGRTAFVQQGRTRMRKAYRDVVNATTCSDHFATVVIVPAGPVPLSPPENRSPQYRGVMRCRSSCRTSTSP